MVDTTERSTYTRPCQVLLSPLLSHVSWERTSAAEPEHQPLAPMCFSCSPPPHHTQAHPANLIRAIWPAAAFGRCPCTHDRPRAPLLSARATAVATNSNPSLYVPPQQLHNPLNCTNIPNKRTLQTHQTTTQVVQRSEGTAAALHPSKLDQWARVIALCAMQNCRSDWRSEARAMISQHGSRRRAQVGAPLARERLPEGGHAVYHTIAIEGKHVHSCNVGLLWPCRHPQRENLHHMQNLNFTSTTCATRTQPQPRGVPTGALTMKNHSTRACTTPGQLASDTRLCDDMHGMRLQCSGRAAAKARGERTRFVSFARDTTFRS